MSNALERWERERVDRLDELETVHRQLTGTSPGRRWATEQIDRGYVVALASQFQGYCRDLHTEAAGAIASHVPAPLRALVESSFVIGRHLDRGNATAGNIGADFGRFGLQFWDAVYDLHGWNAKRRNRLDQVMAWRNAIAHESAMKANVSKLVSGTHPTMTWGRNGVAASLPWCPSSTKQSQRISRI